MAYTLIPNIDSRADTITTTTQIYDHDGGVIAGGFVNVHADVHSGVYSDVQADAQSDARSDVYANVIANR